MNSSVTHSSTEEKEVLFHPELLKKFDINGPRYTSYPSADRFHGDFSESDYLGALERVAKANEPLSLYFHLPFCPNICYYCGCNKIITKDHGRSAKYIKYLAKEMAMVTKTMGAQNKIPVTQLHWGGGTPTFLSHEEMIELMQHTREHFELLPGGEYSIEIDPRRVTEQDIALLAELGFNRISLGVQDFNLAVQEVVHRVQTIEETQAVMDWSRKYGFKSRSVDLIYGLPKQTPETFKETVDAVLAMSPDRLSVYNYAHLPHIFKPQRRIAEADLPAAADKLDILSNTIARLGEAGYVFIGMDHFARPDDELAIAQKEGNLHRNFQGYSTQAECDLLAFGISSIGKVDDCYSQNVRTLDEYYEALDNGHLPVLRGLRLDKDDLLRRELIGELMCQFALDTKTFATSHQIDFSNYFKVEIEELKGLEEAGLLDWEGESIVVPTKGRLLARRVAMTFDRHLRESQAKGTYSKVL
ncbi:oxygen-independent coproporphyrinogen III oxidase [Polynucleobacter sp. AP-Reno-20A-A9]|uniref:oxygen-independent coproporphyrinogen III oxidase n=1 Tax=Polynucleobacter sp. AP-Reno-20A-A9 TaxID=2576925 RepID=UPI001C0E12B5|nr:oxygen-independent coproporphyrinogen III oxidase [Polynucleobacter sp. AP-Reno-20A-A9]MBU3628688.1 oxygen-independent coproporphyrinogen III oxidase [Polynucleobacter sp. AP-Reno-20A-A9]